jgi:ABC-type sugar transport system ATPase subunit
MVDITLRDISKQYGSVEVLHGINADIKQGDFIVILGPSGCGKSTLLRMIAGLEDISGGELLFDDRLVNEVPPKDRGCAMVFQNYALYPHMTVRDNIGYGLRVAKIPKMERESRILKAAEILDLGDYLDRKPSQLSGGQRQRVAIGRAIAREPEVFLFDEPLSNLDARLRVDTRAELRTLHDNLGITSIFVTHDQNEAMTLADTIIILNSGLIEQIGSPLEIYNNPNSVFVAGFVGAPPASLIEATVATDPKFAHIGGSEELSFELPIIGLTPGQKLIVGIRAEFVKIEPDGLPAEIEFAEELGSVTNYYLKIGDQRLAYSDAAIGRTKISSKIGVSFSKDLIWLFDPKSGNRLRG